MKHLKQFNESWEDEFEYRSDVISKDHRDNKSKLQEGDNITFYWAKRNYRTNKNDVSEQTGKIIEIVDSSKEIVDFDVKVLPDSEELRSMTNDKDGYIWISSHDIKYPKTFNESKEVSKKLKNLEEGYYLAIGKRKYTKNNALNQQANVFTKEKVVLYDLTGDSSFEKYMKKNPLKNGKEYCTLHVDDEGNIDSYQ